MLALSLFAAVIVVKSPQSSPSLSLSRRHAMGALAGAAFAPAAYGKQTKSASFINDGIPEREIVEQQLNLGDRVDLNNSPVTDYKRFPGMYPRIAGLLASHGPYRSVQDAYKVPGLSNEDKLVIQKNFDKFAVLPPGRGFHERINARHST
jgi:photosystem II PsbU protein